MMKSVGFFRPLKRLLSAALGSVALALATPSLGAGLLQPTQQGGAALEIKSHEVDVVIQDGFSTTTIDQVFSNPNNVDLEAMYAFPLPDKAAVAEFVYWIDGKPVQAEVVEARKAREIYTEEKQQGRETALVEQDDFRRFEINVSPVRAGADVRVKLVYHQLADVDTNIGRYLYPLEEGGVDDAQADLFWGMDDNVAQRFAFRLTLRSSHGVAALRLPNVPDAMISKVSEQEWHAEIVRESNGAQAVLSPTSNDDVVALEEAKYVPAVQERTADIKTRLNKDIVVYWRLNSDLPASVDMINYRPEGADKGTFMLTITPADDLQPIQQSRDWFFVLDKSGSMEHKYETLLKGIKKAMNNLRSEDRYQVVMFDKDVHDVTRGWRQAVPTQISHTIADLERVRPGGGTNLYRPLEAVINSLNGDNTVGLVLVTDGVVNNGPLAFDRFSSLLKKHDVRLFTMIMGNSANKPLLEPLTKLSNGFAVHVSNSDDIVGKLFEATNKVSHQAMHDVSIDIDGIQVSHVTPRRIGSLYRGDQLVVMGHYKGEGDATITFNATQAGKRITRSTTINFKQSNTRHPELRRLWALAAIDDMEQRQEQVGENADTKQAITDLAIQYGLVTKYTSMLVLREQQYQRYGIERNNAKAVQVEAEARRQRQAQAVTDNRVDYAKPLNKGKRSSYSSGGSRSSGGSSGGSGSVDWFWLLLVAMTLLITAPINQRVKQ